MQTQTIAQRKKTIWTKLHQRMGLLLFGLILTACGQSSGPQHGVISDDKLSAPLPKAITAFSVDGSTLIVNVVVNGDTDNPLRVKNLSVNTTEGTFSGDVPGVPTGTSTLSLVYSIIDPILGTIEVIRTADITVNVVANEDTPADFSSAEITYTDTDGDGISNLDELEAGTNPIIPNYTVGGQVEGLTGSGLILQNNGSDDLAISAGGTFNFSPTAIDGDEYAVSVLTQPGNPNQTCTVNNDNGSINGIAVSNVTIICSTASYTIGGTVSGYTGSGLVLQNNGSDDLTISANGTFTFSSAIIDGSEYAVSVRTLPDSPNQICSVSNGSGTLGGTAVSSITVTCSTNAYTVGGTVSGYASSGLVLQNNGSDDLTINAEGNFTFSNVIADGSNYTVTVLTQPGNPNQVCTISNGSGAVSGAAISGVTVSCSTTSYMVGGTVSGYTGNGLVLQNNGGDDLTINAEGNFTFNSAVADSSEYAVSVLIQPNSPNQVCTISNGSGTLGGAAISSVTVACSTTSYTVGGTVSGYTGSGLVLQNNNGDDLPVSANGAFSFNSALTDGSGYAVRVQTQPDSPNQICTVNNGHGIVSGAVVSGVAIICSADSYTVGGTVSGYAGSSLVLQNNGSDDLTINAGGNFTFSSAVANGSNYTVTVLTQPGSLNQMCTVSNGSGTISGTAVSNVSVICNTAPTATSVTITDINGGNTAVGNRLSGSYTYTDAESDPEGVSTFRWLVDGIAIAGATTASYVPVASDNGKTITFEVTPVASAGIITGVAARSDGLVIMANSAPFFTSNVAISVTENIIVTGYTATTADADGDTVTFSLSGGADQEVLSIDNDSGVLSFNIPTRFKDPADSDGNNTYVVEITATDGIHSIARSVTVTVTMAILDVSVSSANLKTVRFEWSAYVDATNYKLFVNPDSASGFSLLRDNLSDTSTTVTITLPAHLTDWINVRYILEAHNASGKLAESSPVSITALMLSNIGYVKASNTGAFDLFGSAMSLSADGNTLAIGAPGEDSVATGVSTGSSGSDGADNTTDDSGAVYMFSRNGGVWEQQAYIKASNTEMGDKFGFGVSLSANGNTLAVGAPEEDRSTGAVYVFNRSGGTWSQQAYVKASNAGANDSFGEVVGLSADGNTLAVGASGEDSVATDISTDGSGETDNTADNSGAVYMFSRSGGTWSQQAYVKASNTGMGDRFGNAISLSGGGNTLAVGAHEEDGAADNSGAVYVFSRSSGAWSQLAYIKASNTGKDDWFGSAMSLSDDGSTLAVGAWGEDSAATGVSTDGNGEDDNTASNSGAIYVFSRNSDAWDQQAYIKASNTGGGGEKFLGSTSRGDWFGRAVSLSGNGDMLAVGAEWEDSAATGVSTDGSGEADNTADNSGAVYVFSRSGGIWSQRAYVKASNTEGANNIINPSDLFGRAVSLSVDGNMLAVGARFEDSADTGVSTGGSTSNSASNAGAVYLY